MRHSTQPSTQASLTLSFASLASDCNISQPVDRTAEVTYTPAQETVLGFLYGCPCTLEDLCSSLEATTRYTRYTLARIVAELVETGAVWSQGNLVGVL